MVVKLSSRVTGELFLGFARERVMASDYVRSNETLIGKESIFETSCDVLEHFLFACPGDRSLRTSGVIRAGVATGIRQACFRVMLQTVQ
jgi:hypothetical protein